MGISHRAGPWITAFLLAGSTIILNWHFLYPVLYVLSGKVFQPTPLYHPTWGTWDRGLVFGFFLFGYFTVITITLLLLIRWISNRKSKTTYWIFAALSFILFLQPLCILTITTRHLVMYIATMGFTPMRIAGLGIAAGGYLATFGFLVWAAGRLPKQQKIESV